MAVLGIIILLGVAAVTATVVADGSDAAEFELVGLNIDTTYAGIYAIGAFNLLLAVLGIVLVLGGAKRARRRRKEVRELRRQADAPTVGDSSGGTRGRGGDPVYDQRPGHRAREDGPDDEHFRGVPRE
jgi:hypothetical protein